MIQQWLRKIGITIALLAAVGLAWSEGANQLFFEGFELLKDGKANEAAAKFEEGLKSDSNNAVARYYLGEAYFVGGQKDKAREQLSKSLELDANSQVAEEARKRLAELSMPSRPAAQAVSPRRARAFKNARSVLRWWSFPPASSS